MVINLRHYYITITDAKLYVPVVTLSSQHNVKLLKQLESGFERKINWIKYQSKLSIEGHNQDLYYLIDPIFKGVNRDFFLPSKNNVHRTRHTGYFIQKVEIKYFNFMIDGQSFFD